MTDFAPYLQLLNVLLVPLFVMALKLSARLQRIESEQKAHDEMDAVKFAQHEKDIARAEAAAAAAHRRLDRAQLPAAAVDA